MKLSLAALLMCMSAVAQSPMSMEHVEVYKEKGRFAGWPANHGIWSWGNEILVGFEVGYYQDHQGHNIDRSRPVEHVLARSLDGGHTWDLKHPGILRPPLESAPGSGEGATPVCSERMDFERPGFVLTFRRTGNDDAVSCFYYSYDRGKNWEGPCRLPNFGQPGIAARTDYLVNGRHDLTALLTAAKSDRQEGRVICVRTRDGGQSWNFVSFIGPEPEDYAIMPSTVRFGPGELFTAIRRRRWIDTYRSNDNGESWHFVNQAVLSTGGNPPSLVKVSDGHLVLTYGFRLPPYGVRARLSKDHGQTWGEEIVLRKDGGHGDLGYPRTVQRADGKLVTVYYFNDSSSEEASYIAATIWDPFEPSP